MIKKSFCFLFFSLFAVCISAQSYEELIKLSYEYADSNLFANAEDCLKKALRLEPANKYNYALLTNLGTLQRRQGKYDDALISYTAALGQNPKDPMILQNRAELFVEMNNLDQALGDFNTLLANDPTNEQGLYNRGLLYIGKGEFLLAQADFELILQKYSDSFSGRLGFAILEKARGNYTESEVIFDWLADKYKDNLRVLEERAELYFLTKRNRRAMNDLNKVFSEVKEPTAEMYMLRGRIKLAQFEKESAALDFRKARELGYDEASVERMIKETY